MSILKRLYASIFLSRFTHECVILCLKIETELKFFALGIFNFSKTRSENTSKDLFNKKKFSLNNYGIFLLQKMIETFMFEIIILEKISCSK